jgi:hypothetical protein
MSDPIQKKKIHVPLFTSSYHPHTHSYKSTLFNMSETPRKMSPNQELDMLNQAALGCANTCLSIITEKLAIYKSILNSNPGLSTDDGVKEVLHSLVAVERAMDGHLLEFMVPPWNNKMDKESTATCRNMVREME